MKITFETNTEKEKFRSFIVLLIEAYNKSSEKDNQQEKDTVNPDPPFPPIKT